MLSEFAPRGLKLIYNLRNYILIHKKIKNTNVIFAIIVLFEE